MQNFVIEWKSLHYRIITTKPSKTCIVQEVMQMSLPTLRRLESFYLTNTKLQSS